MRIRGVSVLLPGLFLAIWCSVVSGFLLPAAPRLLLAAHLAGGFGGLIPLVLFMQGHGPARRDSPTRLRYKVWGRVLLGILAMLALTGVLLLRWTNVEPLQQIHAALALALVVVMTVHVGLRFVPARRQTPRRHWGRHWRTRRAIRPWLLSGVVSLAFLTSARLSGPTVEPYQNQAWKTGDNIPLAHASLGGNELPRQSDCTTCHSDIGEQWSRSLHAHAATDPYYVALATLFIQERGVDAARYCAACHNPIGLVRGEIDADAVRDTPMPGEARSDKQSAAAYRARALDVELAMSAPAAEGVSCAVCHQAEVADTQIGNGSLRLRTATEPLPESFFDELLLRAVPSGHVDSQRSATLADASLCGACHNLRSPTGVLLEPTYDEWLASPYPERGVTCQDCHMVPARARVVDSSLSQPVALHGGMPGAPSSLPALSDPILADNVNLELLAQAARLAGNLEVSDGKLQATVTITNSGAGHYLPTGADDLRQVWLEATLYESEGRILWQSGALDDNGRLDPEAVRFQKILGNEQGQAISLHRFWTATQILSDTRLAPLEARTVRYAIDLSPRGGASYRLQLRLLYRDVSQSFAEFAMDGPVSGLPVYEMTRAESVLSGE